MREIKYRAWNGTRMNFEIAPINGESYIVFETKRKNAKDLHISRGKIMQYIGIKDKNGVEIYEGDIVAASFWDDEQKIYPETASVEFDEGSFILKIPNDEWSYFNGTQSVEVIGNIHEHSRLLEGEAE